MNIERDYEDFLRLLDEHEVRHCIVGSFAMAVHARPRYTKDMDILVDPTPANAHKVFAALKGFGFASSEITEQDFLDPETVVQLGYEPVRIDLLTSIAGCSFQQAWDNRVTVRYGSVDAIFIGKRELAAAKRASGRTQDLADLELLEGI